MSGRRIYYHHPRSHSVRTFMSLATPWQILRIANVCMKLLSSRKFVNDFDNNSPEDTIKLSHQDHTPTIAPITSSACAPHNIQKGQSLSYHIGAWPLVGRSSTRNEGQMIW